MEHGNSMHKLRTKLKTLFRLLTSDSVSFGFLLRYAFGQLLAYSGIGKYISFSTSNYRLYLTRSPVAMVAYGSPHISRDEELVAQDILVDGDICLDIGANIGTFSLVASGVVGETGKVIAFEAHPVTASYMEKNISLNKKTNISLVQKALGEKAGVIGFSNDGYDDVNHVAVESKLKVEIVRLDDCNEIQHIQTIKLIKLDVEGFELFVLQGGEKTFSKAQYVLFEAFDKNCKQFGYSVKDLYSWFESHGFTLINQDTKSSLNIEKSGQDFLCNVLAVRNSP